MINGDVRDFLQRRDWNEWTVLYKGKGYFSKPSGSRR